MARRVIKREYGGPFHGRITYTLECGHSVIGKVSDGVPDRKLCKQCCAPDAS